MSSLARVVVCLALIPCSVTRGQSISSTSNSTPPILTIEQAVALARRNNPDYLATRNNSRSAAAELRSARGALLPRLNASLSGQYQQGGRQFVSGVALGANTDALQSQYSLGVNYQINAASFIAPKVQRANSEAVDADIAGAAENLSAVIRQNYLTAPQYAVGLATFVDLTTSRTAFAQAEADRINAVYNYHKAFAALESAIGRPLR